MVQQSKSLSNDGMVPPETLSDVEIQNARWLVIDQPAGQCVAGVFEVQIGEKSARITIELQSEAVKIVMSAVDGKPFPSVEDIGRNRPFLAHLNRFLDERGRAPDNGVSITLEFPAQQTAM